MTENSVNPPCILDPRKQCLCVLSYLAQKNVEAQATVHHTDLIGATEIIRSKYEQLTPIEQIQYLLDQISVLSKRGILSLCEDFLSATKE